MRSIEDLQNDLKFTTAKTGEERTITFLPDPPRAERRYTVISADDHIVEPPDTFEGRVPKKYAERAPRVVETDDGGQMWVYDGVEMPNIGFNAVVGRPVSEYSFEPVRFEHMRRGAWDVGRSSDGRDRARFVAPGTAAGSTKSSDRTPPSSTWR